MENENEFYKAKNEELLTQVKKREFEKESMEEDYPKYNRSDFLKCLYAQAHYLESE